MNVMLISQCSKNALTETRRILDQFAERRGERSWQTAITRQGLDTVHRLLRKSGRKNSAVACLWIRGKNQTELLWIVGDRRKFNDHGGTPTNETERDILRWHDENDWHHAEEIRLLSSLAALFHDFGKANTAFQEKLSSKKPIADAFRHEWISLRLFQAFIGNDNDIEWLTRLAEMPSKPNLDWIDRTLRDGVDEKAPLPLKNLPQFAKVIAWLILTHHRLPANPDFKAVFKPNKLPNNVSAKWCGARLDSSDKEKASCWKFPFKVPFSSKPWRRYVGRVANAILGRPGLLETDWLADPFVIHLSRLALTLGDHFYSGEPRNLSWGDVNYPLIANTDRRTGKSKQRLDEHLVGVGVNTSQIVRALPQLELQVPRIAKHKGFRKRTRDKRFRWQDQAYDLAGSLRESAARQGFFGINMASTGCGKTLANGRIIYALAHPQRGARFNIALGLRALTLQTGDSYRERLGLGAEDLAVLVGGGTTRHLHEEQKKSDIQLNGLSHSGSESTQSLLEEQDFVHYEGCLIDGPLKRWIAKSPDAQKLLDAPILVCTIDHLIPATEGTRGGHQIAPMLRLLTSDLILDEPDDFSMEDLPALTRLVHWTGLLGGRLLLSSATLPPALVEGLFRAYKEGRCVYQQNRGEPGLPVNICCAWFDEFGARASEHATSGSFTQAHQGFVEKRVEKLARVELRRKALIVPFEVPSGNTQEAICAELAQSLVGQFGKLHNFHNSKDPNTRKRVSFGLVRMANIGPLVEVAKSLFTHGASDGQRIHLCVYHSQHPLLVRSGIERRLDRLLNRKKPLAVFQDQGIRKCLDENEEKDQLFIVLATAVAEVGRDHDYDWAIVEPSSLRSIIQLAGRVRRHRPGECESPNIYLLDTNVRHLEFGGTRPAFCRPGFESSSHSLKYHRLTKLLSPTLLTRIDATPRILARSLMNSRENLADLEHSCLEDLMLGEKSKSVQTWWKSSVALTGEFQRCTPFRYDPLGRVRYGLLIGEDAKVGFYRFQNDGTTTLMDNLKHDISLKQDPTISFWGDSSYEVALEELADFLEIDKRMCSRKFGVLDLPERGVEQGWNYHSALGFSRHK